jgi:RNA polymerase sigma-70 factor, ECF subfamily
MVLTAKMNEVGMCAANGSGDLTTAQRENFDRLWQEHRPRIWRLVARLASSTDLADDLTQEVSVRAFQAFGDFRGEAGAFTWLYRIAINVVNRHRERRQRETVPLDSPEMNQLPADKAASPESIALESDRRAAVWSALERLPDELRTTLILQIFEGLKYREVAGVLNIPIGTVKSRLHHAIQRLREEFKDHEL